MKTGVFLKIITTIIDKKYYIKIQKEQKSTWIEIPEEKYFNLKIGDDYNENT